MNIVPTEINEFRTRTPYTEIDKNIEMNIIEVNDCPGLKYKYSVRNNPEYNDLDALEIPNNYAGTGYGNREFSIDNQMILKQYLNDWINKKDKLCIVEIGVNRNTYNESSTSIFLDNKRSNDIYIGIDIEDKSFLNNSEKNIHTIQSKSENIEYVLNKFSEIGIQEIDILMIDGWHSINTVYTEWKYTKILSEKGLVVFHDTNGHPGPYFIIKSIDTTQYDIFKYFSDIKDFGISFAVRK